MYKCKAFRYTGHENKVLRFHIEQFILEQVIAYHQWVSESTIHYYDMLPPVCDILC